MGSNATFVIATGLGLYPVMGSDRYWLSPPRFRESILRVGMEDATLRITAEGADPAGEAPAYIVGASLDGTPLERSMLYHHELVGGPGETRHLRLQLAGTPGDWGTTSHRL